MSENLGHPHEPSTDGWERVVVVGLIATPPDHPARVAGRLSAELAELLSSRVDHRVRWEVRGNWGAVAPAGTAASTRCSTTWRNAARPPGGTSRSA